LIPKRIEREEVSSQNGSRDSTLLAVATLNGADRASRAQSHPKGESDEQKISVFWRVFGGAIISIAALAAITLYNNLATGIAELRTEIGRGNEARAELVKKDEFNSRSTSMWNRIQELQAMQLSMTSLKEKVSGLEQQLRAADEDHKALLQAQVQISGLQEKAASREAQAKAVEEERKTLCKELLVLRERIAKLEGLQGSRTRPKNADNLQQEQTHDNGD
jgi:predicted  nucleic acid-binding Zn-ribbon protein